MSVTYWAYGLPVKQDTGFRLWDWKKILLASAVGVGLGLRGAAFQLTNVTQAQEIVKSEPETKTKSLTAVTLPAAGSTDRSSSIIGKSTGTGPRRLVRRKLRV